MKEITEAMILAAGEGKRLLPLTKFVPKPLLPIVGKPILEHIIQSLKQQGITELCINAYHLKGKIIHFLKENDFGIEIRISAEEKILGTGGGIGRMRKYIKSDDFVVYNSDIVTDIAFEKAWKFHRESEALVTLVLTEWENSKDVLLLKNGKIIDIAGKLERDGQDFFGFTGISIVNRKIFDFLPENRFYNVADAYAEVIKAERRIFGFISQGNYWLDMGTKENYLKVHKDILVDKKDILCDLTKPEKPFFIGKDSVVSKNAKLSGFVSIGKNCIIGDDVKLENCVIFDDTVVDNGKAYENCIMSNDFNACISR